MESTSISRVFLVIPYFESWNLCFSTVDVMMALRVSISYFVCCNTAITGSSDSRSKHRPSSQCGTLLQDSWEIRVLNRKTVPVFNSFWFRSAIMPSCSCSTELRYRELQRCKNINPHTNSQGTHAQTRNFKSSAGKRPNSNSYVHVSVIQCHVFQCLPIKSVFLLNSDHKINLELEAKYCIFKLALDLNCWKAGRACV